MYSKLERLPSTIGKENTLSTEKKVSGEKRENLAFTETVLTKKTIDLILDLHEQYKLGTWRIK